MRLLKLEANGEVSLTSNVTNPTVTYAILSHTWGEDGEEVTFEDLELGSGKKKVGYKKLLFCGQQAARDGLQYFWVDTCCIKKSSDSELSEAINSMFRWYQEAAKCYVYLTDVSTSDNNQVDSHVKSWKSAFRKSRWFTRGWTLQELIAPRSVEFFCSNGRRLGDKKSLERQLCKITKIAALALQGASLSTFSVAERFSWKANRQTKRAEDIYYSLLGIFDISMPLIYGEGAKKALERLQEEIYKNSKRQKLKELATVSRASDSPERYKILQRQSSSAPPDDNLNFFSPKPQISEYSAYSDKSSPETVKELETGIDPITKQSLIQQLYFTKIDERLTSLTAPQGTTCRWFITNPKYISWLDIAQQTDHGGFIWIRGNPGTGKSTLMKYVFQTTKLKVKDDRSQIILSFFFLARGVFEEKSTTGLYRSLLHQLLQRVVELEQSLEWMTTDGAKALQRSGWHDEALKQTLILAIKKLESRSLTIFIDALDECDDKQATGMVSFFEELCDVAREARVQLKICFSSRYYPTIDIQKGIKVNLEDELCHMEDIKQYINARLKVGKTKKLETLQSDIFKKSSGIFLWVVLVVEILNSEHRNGSAAAKTRDRLEEIPKKLDDLFEMITTRDEDNLDRLQICLKCIFFATRPLKPPELYFAIQISLDKGCSGFWDQDDVDLDQIKTFIISSSKGLAEVTRNNAAEVQFIHESVRDYLLNKYEDQWSWTSSNFIGNGHEMLKNCCLVQLGASINEHIHIPDPPPTRFNARELRETILAKFPFLEYSVFSILFHANCAQQNAIDQGDFLAGFPLQWWVFLNNIIENERSYVNERIYTRSVSILYILAERNLAALIRVHPQRESCFDVEPERYGLPILAALANRSCKAVLAFLEAQAEIQPDEPALYHLCKQYSASIKKRNISYRRDTFSSKRSIFYRNFTFSSKRSIFSHLAELSDDIVLAFFIASGKPDVKEQDDIDGRTPLSWVARSGHEAVVRLQLEKGAELDSEDRDCRTPLSCATGRGHEAIVKLLLNTNKVDVNSKDANGRTPLSWAAGEGHEAIVELLLEKSADLESRDSDGRTPLSWAAGEGHEAIIKILTDKSIQGRST